MNNTGEVLSPDELDHLHDRFYRTDQSRALEGYGLGLSLAQSIVRRHHGEITAESSPARETTFSVTLPLQLSS